MFKLILKYKNFVPVISNTVFVAENSTVIGSAEIKNNASVWFGAVIRGDSEPITVGENSNIQDNCTVHSSTGCPVNIGNNVTVGHNAVVHGCTIGNNCLIGMGSTVMNGAVIGNNCVVGAGALVTENKTFPDNTLIVGVPAKAVSVVDENAVKMITENAVHYVELAKEYRNMQ